MIDSLFVCINIRVFLTIKSVYFLPCLANSNCVFWKQILNFIQWSVYYVSDYSFPGLWVWFNDDIIYYSSCPFGML